VLLFFLDDLLYLIEPLVVATDQDERAVLASSSAVSRPMPEVGPVMMYAFRSEGSSKMVRGIFGIW
jgi:hypothetical protein